MTRTPFVRRKQHCSSSDSTNIVANSSKNPTGAALGTREKEVEKEKESTERKESIVLRKEIMAKAVSTEARVTVRKDTGPTRAIGPTMGNVMMVGTVTGMAILKEDGMRTSDYRRFLM